MGHLRVALQIYEHRGVLVGLAAAHLGLLKLNGLVEPLSMWDVPLPSLDDGGVENVGLRSEHRRPLGRVLFLLLYDGVAVGLLAAMGFLEVGRVFEATELAHFLLLRFNKPLLVSF